VTLQESHYDCLGVERPVTETLVPFGCVHVPSKPADESFVGFDFASELPKGTVLHGAADSVHHMPRGLLSDPQGTGHFVAPDTVLAVDDHPHVFRFYDALSGKEPCGTFKVRAGFLKSGFGFP